MDQGGHSSASRVRHDLRGPVASIRACAATLQARDGELPEPTRAVLLDILNRQSGRLEWCLAALETMAGLTDGRDPRPVDVEELAIAAAESVDIELSLIPTPAECGDLVVADADCLRLAFETIFIAMECFGQVELAVCPADGTITVSAGQAAVDLTADWRFKLASGLLGDEGFQLLTVVAPTPAPA